MCPNSKSVLTPASSRLSEASFADRSRLKSQVQVTGKLSMPSPGLAWHVGGDYGWPGIGLGSVRESSLGRPVLRWGVG